MPEQELIPHLFRKEYSKIVSVLCRHFGFDQIETAEDIAADTFLAAAETWGLKGIPPDPAAWLYHVAKNKAKNYLKHNSIFNEKIVREITSSADGFVENVIDLTPQNINDSLLRMMFAVCHPSISHEAQIGLSLRILCGFGIEEIADAFLTNKETINKRLYRAKEKLKSEKVNFELPDTKKINARLVIVLRTIYLLFNEGYYSISRDDTISKDICLEAMRLCNMLVENEETNKPEVNALLSLMCFHSSRLEARMDMNGEIILYEDQDINLWDPELIRLGEYFLSCSAKGDKLSKYHLEAAIAHWHTIKDDSGEKWENILQLYNRLLTIEYSPVAALNRTYALSKANGIKEAIIEAEKLKLHDNHFYYTLLGEFYTGIDKENAMLNFQKALSLAKTNTDKRAIKIKITRLSHQLL